MGDWFPKRRLGDLPWEAAARFGGREALAFKGRRWTFRQFAEDVELAAQALLALGVGAGDKVSLWLPNRPEWLHLMFAILRVGAVLVPVNTRLRAGEIAYLLRQSNSTTFIATDRSGPADYRPVLAELFPELAGASAPVERFAGFPDLRRVAMVAEEPRPGTVSWREALAKGSAVSGTALRQRADAVDPDATALILYTSGTTGLPKGVMHGHAMIRNMTDHANRMGVTQSDVILMYLPLFHVFGFTEGPLASLLTGARQVLMETFSGAEALDLIAAERATLIHGFDTHFKDLLEEQERRPRDVSSLRAGILAAGMASSTPIARRANAKLMRTFTAFGMSEVSVGACLSFPDSSEEQRCETSGYPAPGYEIAILDPAGGGALPANTPGEIAVRGYMAMQGYYGKPEETARAMDAQGWLHSGDMGFLRDDGYLVFMGRYKDMLKTGGENVDPMEVEGFLLDHPGVWQVAVVGAPDERLGEVGVAFVVPKPGAKVGAEEIAAFCKGRIASFKVPRHVILVEDLPMTSSGKIQKAKLREQAKAQLAKGPK